MLPLIRNGILPFLLFDERHKARRVCRAFCHAVPIGDVDINTLTVDITSESECPLDIEGEDIQYISICEHPTCVYMGDIYFCSGKTTTLPQMKYMTLPMSTREFWKISAEGRKMMLPSVAITREILSQRWYSALHE
eukprot:GILJ01033437.1.p1 GENE.GILJ01033437.1~~GILJ01033437.1.p1  ORF type:complete len:136 (+),score=9.05 GILJ01033437.1:46-453(+)